ncbi:glycine zipper 2TM domain-containing protein [Massilia sp. CCM 8734]|uniref:glycine zipper 2TM domain-containing protein n=1 Tax=Massilia sp. CCM 8734 TaxID=2609283 RepID=UPI0014201691|nr:glycine zipper 2TM domain-containing protein [Massilia sp. CCM 8734]NHZ99309.1 glycine zipper 2TM domain-containing protein [Massilia sp. CCM 8734]
MTTPSPPAPRSAQHPLLIAAAVAVIVFCGAGTVAILGWIPSSIGGTPAKTELSEIDRAVLASTLQSGAAATAPRTLAALDAPGTGAERDTERDAARYRAAQRAENQRLDDLRAGREREEKRAALYDNTAAPARDAARDATRDATREPAPEHWCNHCGNIESVREITQRAQGSGLGAAGGAVLGGLLGNQVGGGNGRKLATVAGAVGGAVVGNQVEGNLKATRSYEIRVRLDDGGARTFHQQSAAGWRTGDRVKVVNGALRPVA